MDYSKNRIIMNCRLGFFHASFGHHCPSLCFLIRLLSGPILYGVDSTSWCFSPTPQNQLLSSFLSRELWISCLGENKGHSLWKSLPSPQKSTCCFFAQPSLLPFCLWGCIFEGQETKINPFVPRPPFLLPSSRTVNHLPFTASLTFLQRGSNFPHFPNVFSCRCLSFEPQPHFSPSLLSLKETMAPSLPGFPPVSQSLRSIIWLQPPPLY